MMQLDRQTAERRLTNRWLEQCELSPTFARDIPLALYVRRNIGYVLKSPLGLEALQDYQNRA